MCESRLLIYQYYAYLLSSHLSRTLFRLFYEFLGVVSLHSGGGLVDNYCQALLSLCLVACLAVSLCGLAEVERSSVTVVANLCSSLESGSGSSGIGLLDILQTLQLFLDNLVLNLLNRTEEDGEVEIDLTAFSVADGEARGVLLSADSLLSMNTLNDTQVAESPDTVTVRGGAVKATVKRLSFGEYVVPLTK